MNQLIQLFRNENMKIYKNSRIPMFIVSLVAINMVFGLIMKVIFGGTAYTMWEYLEFSTYLLVLVLIICVVIAGDNVSNEYAAGTIKLLLIHQATRSKVLMSKYASVLSIIFVFVGIQFLVSVLAGLLFFGLPTFQIEDLMILTHVLAIYFFDFIEIIVICTFAFTLSVVTRSSIFSIVFPMFIYFASSAALAILSHYHYQIGKYLLFANTDLHQHFIGRPIFEGMTWSFSIANLGVHMLMFMVLAILVFSKRDIHA